MELRRINFCGGCGDDSCGGGCDSCSNTANANSFEQSLVGVQGKQGATGAQGTQGKNNVLNGSEVYDAEGGNKNGTDPDPLDAGTVGTLQDYGFNPIYAPTLVATVDSTDLVNTKYWVRLSNAFMNFIANSLLPRLLPSGGSTNQVLKKVNGTDYNTVWANQTGEVYNTTSVTSVSINSTKASLQAGTPVTATFTVDANLAYKVGQQVWMIQYNSDTLTVGNYMTGVVTSYSGTSLTIAVLYAFGTGTPTKWYISLGSATQIPYFDATTNNGKYLLNQGGSLVWDNSGVIPTGFTIPWHSSTLPNGWFYCDGSTFTESEAPDLYQHLRPADALTAYAYVVGGGGAAFSSGTARKPSYNSAAFPLGVASSSDIGDTFGANTKVITGDNLPETAPYEVASHTHDYYNDPNVGGYVYGTGGSTGNYTIPSGGFGLVIHPTTGGTTDGDSALTSNTGTGDTPFNVQQLSEGCQWIIKI